jgi:nuclear transport factor 2 (NTF2) superfamily protein
MSRPPLPPFTRETAAQKARMAEDAWNSRDPERVALAYTEDSRWRNRSEFFEGRAAIVAFLTRKWAKEFDYRLIKDLWAFDGNRIAVRFQYEWHDHAGQWHRSYGNEQWEFDEHGLMRRREASINDIAIAERDRRFHWPAPGPRLKMCRGWAIVRPDGDMGRTTANIPARARRDFRAARPLRRVEFAWRRSARFRRDRCRQRCAG